MTMLDVAVKKRLGGFDLNVAFIAPVPGVVALFGVSGAGKSSLVNVIAGLVRPDTGHVRLGDQILFDAARGIDVPVERRRIGYVFQDARLFPHLGVAANLRYGLNRAPAGAGSIGFDTVVDLLGLAPLLTRRPHRLSGGERQRVALGRALLAQPRLLLMDEPLASLDAARKREVLPYVELLRDELKLPIVYVSHAMNEVARMADTLVLLESGRVLAHGPLTELAARADLPLADDGFDVGAIFDAVVGTHDAPRGLTTLAFAGGTLLSPLLDLPAGTRRRLRIRARDVVLATKRPEAISVHNILPGTVIDVTPRGAAGALVRLRVGNAVLLARVTRDAVEQLGLAPGSEAFALLKSAVIETDL